jgi:hypothetical protein
MLTHYIRKESIRQVVFGNSLIQETGKVVVLLIRRKDFGVIGAAYRMHTGTESFSGYSNLYKLVDEGARLVEEP